jgi:hypothetical protein
MDMDEYKTKNFARKFSAGRKGKARKLSRAHSRTKRPFFLASAPVNELNNAIKMVVAAGGSYSAGDANDMLNKGLKKSHEQWRTAWKGKTKQAFDMLKTDFEGQPITVLAIAGGPNCDWERGELHSAINEAAETWLGNCSCLKLRQLGNCRDLERWINEDLPSSSPARLSSSSPQLHPPIRKQSSIIDHYTPLIRRKLANPTLELSVEEQISLLTACMKIGAEHPVQVSGKDVTVIIGDTGVGKSTFANFFLGCDMDLVDPKTLHPPCVGEDVLVVKSVENGGTMDEIPEFKIGHSRKSETFVPQIASVGSFIVADCPGYFDNRGPEIAIANAVNVKQMMSEAKSVRMLVLVSHSSVSDKRGEAVGKIFAICAELFGSEAELRKNLNAIAVRFQNFSKASGHITKII